MPPLQKQPSKPLPTPARDGRDLQPRGPGQPAESESKTRSTQAAEMPSLGWELGWVLAVCDCLRQLRPCPGGCLVLSWGGGRGSRGILPNLSLGHQQPQGRPPDRFFRMGSWPSGQEGEGLAGSQWLSQRRGAGELRWGWKILLGHPRVRARVFPPARASGAQPVEDHPPPHVVGVFPGGWQVLSLPWCVGRGESP